MRFPPPRDGEVVRVRQRPTHFSYWPTNHGKRREKLQSTLFATDPWALIGNKVGEIRDDRSQRQAVAYLAQGKDFFLAAKSSHINAAKPLLLYYSFLNLAKCFIVTKTGQALPRIHHGLSDQLPRTARAIHGSVLVNLSANPQRNAFVDFASALNTTLPNPQGTNTRISVRSQDFLAQVLIGHRVFCRAEGLIERFVSLDQIHYMHNVNAKASWLRVRAYADDFQRLGYPLSALARDLDGEFRWRNVACALKQEERRVIEAETVQTIEYSQRPSQVIETLSRKARTKIWRIVTSYPPYRKYYLYRPRSSQIIFHQLLSLYISTFYFGSISRYRPESFDNILNSPLGPFVLEFFSNQPSQFLYLLASEFIEQEMARAAIT